MIVAFADHDKTMSMIVAFHGHKKQHLYDFDSPWSR